MLEDQRDRLRPRSAPFQDGVRDSIGGVIQLVVRQDVRGRLHRHSPGMKSHLLLEPRRDRAFDVFCPEHHERVRRLHPLPVSHESSHATIVAQCV